MEAPNFDILKKLFIRVNNRKNFLITEVPSLHPASLDYEKWWREQKKRCIEGFWSPDDKEVELNIDWKTPEEDKKLVESSNMWRWMPPPLYFYVNFGTIELDPEDREDLTASKIKARPSLRDLEWEFHYNWAECRGFSGFSGDKEHTCDRRVKYIEDLEKKLDKTSDTAARGHIFRKLSKLKKNLRSSCFTDSTKKTLKKFTPAREYLRKLWDKPMGHGLYTNEAKNLLLLGARGGGKATPLDTPILTTEGWKTMGDLKVGSQVYGRDGHPTTVIQVHPQGKKQVWEVTLQDGRKVECCEDHLWLVNRPGRVKEQVLSTKEMYTHGVSKGKEGKACYEFRVPNCEELKFSPKDLPIEPYILGLLLGDGTMNCGTPRIATDDQFIVDKFKELLGSNFSLKRDKTNNNYRITVKEKCYTNVTTKFKTYRAKRGNELTEKIKELNLYTDCSGKFIPDIYKFSSKEQRVELIQGLIDSDGSVGKNGHIVFSNTNTTLVDDLIFVCRSLGIRCRKTLKEGRPFINSNGTLCNSRPIWTVNIDTTEVLSKLPRKRSRISNKKEGLRQKFIGIVNIKPTDRYVEQKCITVDNNDSTYLTNDLVVTHNSYLVGQSVIAHEFFTDGVKRYDPDKRPPKAEISIGAINTSKSSEIVEKFELLFNEMPGDWAEGTPDFIPSPFSKTTSGSLGPNNIKNPYRWEYNVKQGIQEKKKGSGTVLKHICYDANPQAAAGGRYTVMAVEEVGLMGNIREAHGSNDACQMTDRKEKFGSSVYIGTGGNVEKIQAAEVLFRNPHGSNFLEFDDVWEGNGKIGWFVPSYFMDGGFKDENGNTDVEAAYWDSIYRREDIKKNNPDLRALADEMMNYPIIPSEMFLNALGNRFPQAELKEHLAHVKANPSKYTNKHLYGELVWDSTGEIKWVNKSEHHVVREFPILDNKNKKGIIEIFEPPKKDKDGQVYSGRYIQGTDTYDDDESGTNSLGSTWIFDLWTDRLVAEYTGRRLANEFYEITRKLQYFYNTFGAHNYENNKKGLYGYYDRKHSAHMLCDTPKYLADQFDVKIGKVGNTKKGTNASTPVNNHALDLICDWLLTPAYGEEEGSNVLNLHKIRSVGLLQELIYHSKEGNYDRISALGMVMILRESKLKYLEDRDKKNNREKRSLAQDDYFNRNFNPQLTNLRY